MTTMPEHKIADIVLAAGGRLVSRIRLQKIAYLLDQLGAKSGFDYTYHHYGPYSSDVDSALLDAKAFKLVNEEFGHRKSDNARYSIFTAVEDVSTHKFDYLNSETLRALAARWASTNITVLELAATAHWLVAYEEVADWETEIRRRKGTKVDDGRLEKAKALLADIHLAPAA